MLALPLPPRAPTALPRCLCLLPLSPIASAVITLLGSLCRALTAALPALSSHCCAPAAALILLLLCYTYCRSGSASALALQSALCCSLTATLSVLRSHRCSHSVLPHSHCRSASAVLAMQLSLCRSASAALSCCHFLTLPSSAHHCKQQRRVADVSVSLLSTGLH